MAMQEQNFQPFSENTQLGENRLRFELRNNGLKTADLTSLANLDRKLNVNNHPTKVIPFLFKTQLNGQEILTSSIAILNPADPKNWSPDEFIITFGIPVPNIDLQDFANFFKSGNSFSLINRIYLYATNPNLNPNDPNTIVIPNPSNPNSPTLLDARDPFQSLLSQLLAIEGNDPTHISGYEYSNDTLNISLAITHYLNLVNTDGYGNVLE
ncbi:MAG: hypothetical protein N2578_10365, partial [Bdellovibrionaceae bacterium]|nr:hypothetical protein [Pseudobdellovibrionaceae bacterium]